MYKLLSTYCAHEMSSVKKKNMINKYDGMIDSGDWVMKARGKLHIFFLDKQFRFFN